MSFYLRFCDLYSHFSPYKSKRTVRWDRQSQGIQNVHNKAKNNPPFYIKGSTNSINMKLQWAGESVCRRVQCFKNYSFGVV